MASKKKKGRTKNDANRKEQNICIINFQDVEDQHFVQMNDERFIKVKTISRQPFASSGKLKDICLSIPESFTTSHGYHRKCYQRLTNHAKRGKELDLCEDVNDNIQRMSRKNNNDKDGIIFKPDCIFCEKNYH